jgi:hypothetical protein
VKSRMGLAISLIMVFSTLSFTGLRSHAHTMREVAPDSIQISAPTLPVRNIDDDESPDELEFDDDFSVLV